MSASMTPELRRLMRYRPVTERIALWWLLRRLNRLDARLDRSFVGDAGLALSNHLNAGYSQHILDRIKHTESRIAAITVPVMHGEAA
ncbi:hypothetical protein PXK56_18260 [Phaeobacter gallaeciensis]|uniref:hypothetical protein n=1 Tax=Phaeobacter gallaeciensis TaxID=60890 RepID=UPI00237FDC15|nr:hypothetical protein [Phaeobacter gallaeciensis]MDE4297131.1 hypothetical protein [Phaeobacter gallaeciensis]